jgi:hypothetical protein
VRGAPQAINDGISGTEPFHWNGDMNSFATLAQTIGEQHVASLFRWIDASRRRRRPVARWRMARHRI